MALFYTNSHKGPSLGALSICSRIIHPESYNGSSELIFNIIPEHDDCAIVNLMYAQSISNIRVLQAKFKWSDVVTNKEIALVHDLKDEDFDNFFKLVRLKRGAGYYLMKKLDIKHGAYQVADVSGEALMLIHANESKSQEMETLLDLATDTSRHKITCRPGGHNASAYDDMDSSYEETHISGGELSVEEIKNANLCAKLFPVSLVNVYDRDMGQPQIQIKINLSEIDKCIELTPAGSSISFTPEEAKATVSYTKSPGYLIAVVEKYNKNFDLGYAPTTMTMYMETVGYHEKDMICIRCPRVYGGLCGVGIVFKGEDQKNENTKYTVKTGRWVEHTEVKTILNPGVLYGWATTIDQLTYDGPIDYTNIEVPIYSIRPRIIDRTKVSDITVSVGGEVLAEYATESQAVSINAMLGYEATKSHGVWMHFSPNKNQSINDKRSVPYIDNSTELQVKASLKEMKDFIGDRDYKNYAGIVTKTIIKMPKI